MAVSLLTRFLEHYDPLFCGATASGIPFGTELMAGQAGWCVPGGLHALYRGTPDWSDIDYDVPFGVMSPTGDTPATIAHFVGYTFSASTRYCFGFRAVGRGGAIEENVTLGQRIETDGEAVPLPVVPNPPIRLTAQPKADGVILLQWFYDARGEQVGAATFNVYHNDGAGAVDYGTAIGSTSGRAFLTNAYTHATEVTFGVRAESSAGNEETNTVTVSATADDQGPPVLIAPYVEEGVET